MSVKRFLTLLFIAALIFVSGVTVGKYILSSSVEIVVVDVEKLAVLIERYNLSAEDIKADMAKMKEWNKEALTKPEAPIVVGEEEEK